MFVFFGGGALSFFEFFCVIQKDLKFLFDKSKIMFLLDTKIIKVFDTSKINVFAWYKNN